MTSADARNLKSGFGANAERNHVRPPLQSQEESSLMNVFPRSRSLNGLRTLQMPLAMLLFFLPTLLSAQTVPVSTNGIVGITSGVPPIYSGPYVLQMTEYGFFWLDTAESLAGHVQAVSKCVAGFPTSDSGYYVIADCNTITNVSASGIYAVVRMTSGQCGAQRLGCSGPRDDGHWRFTFGLGTWDYKGDLGEIPDSTQTADPLGRTWSIRPVDSTLRNFSWQVVGGGEPPTATSGSFRISRIRVPPGPTGTSTIRVPSSPTRGDPRPARARSPVTSPATRTGSPLGTSALARTASRVWDCPILPPQAITSSPCLAASRPAPSSLPRSRSLVPRWASWATRASPAPARRPVGP